MMLSTAFEFAAIGATILAMLAAKPMLFGRTSMLFEAIGYSVNPSLEGPFGTRALPLCIFITYWFNPRIRRCLDKALASNRVSTAVDVGLCVSLALAAVPASARWATITWILSAGVLQLLLVPSLLMLSRKSMCMEPNSFCVSSIIGACSYALLTYADVAWCIAIGAFLLMGITMRRATHTEEPKTYREPKQVVWIPHLNAWCVVAVLLIMLVTLADGAYGAIVAKSIPALESFSQTAYLSCGTAAIACVCAVIPMLTVRSSGAPSFTSLAWFGTLFLACAIGLTLDASALEWACLACMPCVLHLIITFPNTSGYPEALVGTREGAIIVSPLLALAPLFTLTALAQLSAFTEETSIWCLLVANAAIAAVILMRTAIARVEQSGSIASTDNFPATSLERFELAQREQMVLLGLFEGKSLAAIAREIGIARATAGTYATRAYHKLHVHSKAEALALLHELSTTYHSHDSTPTRANVKTTALARHLTGLCLGGAGALFLMACISNTPVFSLLREYPPLHFTALDEHPDHTLGTFIAMLILCAAALFTQLSNASRRQAQRERSRIDITPLVHALTCDALIGLASFASSAIAMLFQLGYLAVLLPLCARLADRIPREHAIPCALDAAVGFFGMALLYECSPVTWGLALSVIPLASAVRITQTPPSQDAHFSPQQFSNSPAFTLTWWETIGSLLFGSGVGALMNLPSLMPPERSIALPFGMEMHICTIALIVSSVLLCATCAPMLRRMSAMERPLAWIHPLVLCIFTGYLVSPVVSSIWETRGLQPLTPLFGCFLIAAGAIALAATARDFSSRLDVTGRKPFAAAQTLISSMGLTAAECDIALRLGSGMSATEVARDLFLSPESVKTHRKHLYAKLGIHTVGELRDLLSRAG